MDLLKKRLDIAQLIAEELTGTIDEKDRVVLARWLDEDERHREEYADILESLKTGNEAWKDQERGRQLMESRWGAVKSHTVQKTGRWITWSKYAAVIVLFVSIGIFGLVNEEKQEVENGTVAQIEHGSMKAQLVLANGKKVDLRPETNLQLEEVGGTRILTSDNRVKYSGKDSLAGQPAEVKYNTLIVPRGGEFSLELADGTRVWLNAESRLRYPVVFMGEERKVEMEGEVYFEVAKNREKPFIVTVNGVDIRVLGTSFNVSAYQEEVVTTLVEGKVQLKRGDEQVVLSPNQQAEMDKNSGKITMREVNVENLTNGDKGKLRQVLKDIDDMVANWKDSYFISVYEERVAAFNRSKLQITPQELDDIFHEENYLLKSGKIALSVDYLYESIAKYAFGTCRASECC